MVFEHNQAGERVAIKGIEQLGGAGLAEARLQADVAR